ncbi:unnamed protein product [Soboliphyme baturini]|uniref:Kelch domain-containing protein 10 n=1 Tax=Soboliphyme baturini TaxID=241478 RepID=A0A183IPD8_9BILA|nr:unnamed protein product [Soboliphyme baturini]
MYLIREVVIELWLPISRWYRYILVFGGTAVPFGHSSSDELNVLSLRTLRWNIIKCGGTKPPKQYGHAMLRHRDVLYVVGGTTGFAYNMDVFALPLRKAPLAWHKLESSEAGNGRYRHEIAVYKNQLYVFGGGQAETVFRLDELPVYDLQQHRWLLVATSPDLTYGYPFPRRCHGFALHNNFAYVCGGIDNVQVLNDIWQFQSGFLIIFGGVTDLEGRQRTNRVVGLWLTPSPLRLYCCHKMVEYFPGLRYLPAPLLMELKLPKFFTDWLLGDYGGEYAVTRLLSN